MTDISRTDATFAHLVGAGLDIDPKFFKVFFLLCQYRHLNIQDWSAAASLVTRQSLKLGLSIRSP